MRELSNLFGSGRSGGTDEDHHWLSVSDLMAGLMMVFLFIAIALMRTAIIERDRVRDVAVAYQENQVAIFEALMDEFERDLEAWDAFIDEESLSFTFRSPDVLFATGSTDLQPRFQEILSDFFPRYLDRLLPFEENIDEIRLEGHTSSDWAAGSTERDAYFNNMALSQGRTRSVLDFVYDLPGVKSHQNWIKTNVAAVGLSSSRVILDNFGEEDRERSRRVTFSVKTNAEIQIRSIMERSQ